MTDPFTRAVGEAERLVAAAPHIRTEQDLLDGYRYLAGGIVATTQSTWAMDRAQPEFLSGTGPHTKMGLDNPDTLYFGARISDDVEYVVRGIRGTTTDLSFQVLSGNYTDSNVPEGGTAFDDRALEIEPDGTFEVRFGPESGDGRRNYVQLPAGATQLVAREVYNDWTQRRGTLTIARADNGSLPKPLTHEAVERKWERAGEALVTRVKTWLQFPEWFYLNLPVNSLTEPRLTPGGLATQYSSVGHYDITDRQAIVITVPKSDAPYQGFQLGSMWYISLDYVNHQTSLTSAQAQTDPDGMIRLVVAERNPGVANWIETTGHLRGYLQFRWQRLARELTAADGPQLEVVDLDDVPAHLPYYDSNTIDAQSFTERIAARRLGIASRMLS
nr:hypothetical protein [Rhodococcus sp. HNM0569]